MNEITKENATLVRDGDTAAHRAYVIDVAMKHAAERLQRAETIMCSQAISGHYFWPEQTPEEVRAVKQYLVDIGQASWVIPRDR